MKALIAEKMMLWNTKDDALGLLICTDASRDASGETASILHKNPQAVIRPDAG